jgi:hypothetical protein
MDKNDNTISKTTNVDAQRLAENQNIGRLRLVAYNEMPHGLIVKEDHPLIPRPACFTMDGMDMSGGLMTFPDGRMTWRLSNFMCPGKTAPPVDFPISFVATPLIDKPMYMTVKYIAVETHPNDLVMEIYSWDNRGQPAPSVPFYYRCRIPIIIKT